MKFQAKTHTKRQPISLKLPRYILIMLMRLYELDKSISLINFLEVGLFKRAVFSRVHGMPFSLAAIFVSDFWIRTFQGSQA